MISLVRNATKEDIPEVLKIHGFFIDEYQKEVTKYGFLVHRMDENYLMSLIEGENSALYVHVNENNRIQGYLAVLFGVKFYDPVNIELFDENLRDILEKGNYALLKQIGKKVEEKTSVAVNLENHSFEEVLKRGYHYAIGEIAIENPRNERSLKFHIHRDWKQIGKYKEDSTGIVWGIFAKKLK